MTTQDRIRAFITDELRWDGDPALLTDDYPLIDNKVIDSMGIFHIVTYLEETFGVEIPDEELLPDNFGTLGAIARFVDERRSADA